MTDKILIARATVEQVLEALELSSVTVDSFGVQGKTREAITAMRERLEQPAQRTWVGLTKEERYKTIRPLYNSDKNARLAVEHSNDEYEALEAKLREKNT